MAQVNRGTLTHVQIHTMRMLSQPGPFACQRSWGLISSGELSNLLATVCPELRRYVPLGNQGREPGSGSGVTSSHCHSEDRLSRLPLSGRGCHSASSLLKASLFWPRFQSPDCTGSICCP